MNSYMMQLHLKIKKRYYFYNQTNESLTKKNDFGLHSGTECNYADSLILVEILLAFTYKFTEGEESTEDENKKDIISTDVDFSTVASYYNAYSGTGF